MTDLQVVPVRAFSDNYIWTLRDATHAAVVDPGDARPVSAADSVRCVAASTFINVTKSATGVGTILNSRSPPTTSTADVCPIAYVYE